MPQVKLPLRFTLLILTVPGCLDPSCFNMKVVLGCETDSVSQENVLVP